MPKKKKRELIVIHVHVDCKRVHLRVFKTNPDIYQNKEVHVHIYQYVNMDKFKTTPRDLKVY